MKVEKKFFSNLAALRIFLSFLVVSIHCYKPKFTIRKKIIIKIIYNMVHVPTFYILSFYFSFNLFKSKNIKKIKLRFQRLLIPYLVWPIIIWSLNNLFSFFFIKIDIFPFKTLIIQLLTGNCFMASLWFQYNLIFIDVLIVIIHLSFNGELVLYILINFKILAFVLQYSNYNTFYFGKYINSITLSFGRFFEIITHCIAGYFLSSLNIVHILSKFRILSIYIVLSIIMCILKYKIFFEIKGFGYGGLKLYVSSINLFLLFSLIPNEIFGNKYMNKFIKFISILTPGIYFINSSIIKYLRIFSFLKNGTLFDVIFVYCMSYFISLIGKLIFRNTKLINLFQ